MHACLTAVLSLAMMSDANARPRKKRSTFQVALQPFSIVRSAVHAVADPIVHNAPRAVARAATAPVRIARTVARAVPVDNPREEDAIAEHDSGDDEDFETDERRAPVERQQASVAQPVEYSEPIRVAYVVPRAKTAAPPRAETVPNDDDSYGSEAAEAEPKEATPQFNRAGSKPMVAGSRAVLRNGIAYAPSQAPQAVKNAIWAANSLQRKPYIWGGGHGSFNDRGYDCSGTVSYALHGAGALASPLPSSEFMRYGKRGRGRWITVYSRRGHTFAVIAGLRLDTTDFRNGGNTGPRWHVDGRDTRGYVARHPAGM